MHKDFFIHKPDPAEPIKMSLNTFLLVLVMAATAARCSHPAHDFNITEVKRCSRLAVEHICTKNLAYVRNLLETLVNCGAADSARYIATFCARSDQVDRFYCGAAESYPLDLRMAQLSCDSALQPGGSCSGECYDSLLSISVNLGCCFNTFFNNTVYSALFDPVLSYALWSECRVELPNSTCDDALPYSLPTTPLQTCTFYETAACRESDMNLIRNSIAEDCQVIQQYSLNRCSRKDGTGDACLQGLGTDIAQFIQRITSVCGSAWLNGSCSNECRDTLQNFIDK